MRISINIYLLRIVYICCFINTNLYLYLCECKYRHTAGQMDGLQYNWTHDKPPCHVTSLLPMQDMALDSEDERLDILCSASCVEHSASCVEFLDIPV